VQVVVKAERPGGIILARGGASQGYALYLEGGRPRFGVRADGRLQSVAADGEITGKWAHLAGVITADRKLVLYVNGEPAGEGALDAFIGRDPNDGLQIGADAGSAVVPYGERAGLTGWVASVKIFSGERSAADIRLDAAAPPAGGR
jgi:arylsulfatase